MARGPFAAQVTLLTSQAGHWSVLGSNFTDRKESACLQLLAKTQEVYFGSLPM